MQDATSNRGRKGFLYFSFSVALSVALGLPAARAQTTTSQTPTSQTSTSTLPTVNVDGGRSQKKQEPKKQAWPRAKIAPTATACRQMMSPGKPYFIEFRSRTAASYGHTFVFHGRLNGASFGSYQVAGLHPKGDDPNVYMQGHMIPVPAETGVSYGDLDEQFMTARFCVTLSEPEYRKALAYIRNLQATKTTWHATTYNCNSFASDIAKAIGLDSPNPNMYLPDKFINRLADLNPRGKPSSPFASWGQPATSR